MEEVKRKRAGNGGGWVRTGVHVGGNVLAAVAAPVDHVFIPQVG